VNGATVLVTGSGSGIGREVARQLAERGATVLVSARSPAKARAEALELAGSGEVRTLAVGLDVADPDSVRAAAAVLEADPGRLDVLVNNAAAFVDWGETATGADLDAAASVMQTNLFGAWRLTQALLPLLRRSAHPRIVNVSSGAGSHGEDQFGLARRGGSAASYGISKAALNALTSTLAAELADTPILVNAVCPGLTATWPGAEEMGARPIPDGAASVVWAVTLPDDGPSGGFFRYGRPLPW
jgi:NAD(P)-dependent dehydrogenase (short-subunit alcohol dehydrogenase family)